MADAKQRNDDILWGCEAIAAEIGRERSATFHMLSSGALPPARKIGGRWCASRSRLRAWLRGELEAPAAAAERAQA
ncbi:MAG: hypothetical protein JNK30_18350 [Phenylobacterium sp.]|uniref:hypothetical protein n=1 Tax=Phenylobacterium sp. TaxID=1871053 RepID=UPI001A4FD60B|nr:hypothetical protein [Phenylobacterium sp.]MBL8773351.1 hypothetical protein [Phenylobacterium sp.]